MARSFNGTTDNIRADAARVFSPTAACSFSVWVKGGVQTNSAIYAEASTVNTNNIFELVANGTSVATISVVARSSTGTTTVVTTSTASVFDSTWHHFCYTQDASKNWVLYIDGASDHSGTHTLSSITPNDLAFGALIRSSNTGFYTGSIAEVANWTRKLTAKEVAAIAAGLSASHFAPSHYWPLWGVDSPEPDIGTVTRTTGTLTGTSSTGGQGKGSLSLLTIGGQPAPDQTAGGTGFSLTATAGAVAITGDAVLLPKARGFIAGPGTFTITGDSALLPIAHNLIATLGQVSITGVPATLFVPQGGLQLTPVVPGSLTLTPDTAGTLTLAPEVGGTLTLTPIVPN